MIWWRPLPSSDPSRPRGALPLAGGALWFDRVECLTRDARTVVPLSEVPDDRLDALSRPRAAISGLTLDRPRIMAILNVTPDSFSDGGLFLDPVAAQAQARAALAAGADMLDIGGESTRPGATEVAVADEIARTAPVIAAIRAESAVPISIDTRKAAVARAALDAGADVVNDVSAMLFDSVMPALVRDSGAPVILMHHIGTPATMQDDPRYDDVVLDVYDWLAARVAAAEQAGIARDRIVIDPGIGFGKTLQHNVSLLRHLSLYHGLGVPLLVGASRKRFIGTLTGTATAADRMAGSVAVALHAAAQGAHVLRVHDTMETRQALSLQQALNGQHP